MSNVINVGVTNELSTSYLTYSVAIFGRALPSAIDGLKIAQRRIILGLKDLNLSPSGAYKKVSRLEGHVLGSYHPQGGCSGTAINMGQACSFRYPLTDIHGNVGGSLQSGRSVGQSTSEDGPAAARYLEVKSSSLTHKIFIEEIDKVSIGWRDNYDGSTQEVVEIVPTLPALLINGSNGIASGYAANHTSYQLEEVIDGTIALLKNPNLSFKQLNKHITGPDLPNGARIEASSSMLEAMETGRGAFRVFGEWKFDKVKRGKTSLRDAIIITSLASGSSERFLEKVREGLESEKISGIVDAIDLSSRDGIEIHLVLKPNSDKDLILNQLLAHTTLSESISVNATAMSGALPEVYGIKEIILKWIDKRKECLILRFKDEKSQIDKKIHILDGLLKILSKIDVAIKIIKNSKTKEEAKNGLISKFSIDEVQANAVLAMTLSKLVNVETLELKSERENLLSRGQELDDLITEDAKLVSYISKELRDLRKFGDGRRSKLIPEGSITFSKPKIVKNTIKKTKLPTTQEKIKAEAKTLGVKRTEVKAFFEGNVGKGNLYALWKQFLTEKQSKKRRKRKINT